MTELPSSSSAPGASDSASSPAPAAVPRTASKPVRKRVAHDRLWQGLTLALLVLALLLAVGWWDTRVDLRALRQEVAQRLQTGDQRNQETRQLARGATESARELQLKVNQLENRQTEAQNQQLALEQLYEELSKNRDDWALAETEQVLSTADQQLELAGNVRGALIALQNADARLARSEHPQSPVIRRAIASDMEKLRLLPNVDLPGLAARLDQLIARVDSLPLLTEEAAPLRQARQGVAAAEDGSAPPAAAPISQHPWLKRLPPQVGGWLDQAQAGWHGWTHEFLTDLKQVVRVRTVGTPDALLLSPTEEFYARENLKLRLLSARLALLSRNETTFRQDLSAAQDMITRYFDAEARSTRAALQGIKQVQDSDLSIDMPTLADSLSAIRSYQARSQ